MTAILGISAFYHDSAAALVIDGEIIAAAQEERFTRIKHDHSFPQHAIDYCLAEAGLAPGDLDFVGFYDKPFMKFERLLETYLSFAPAGFRSFLKAMPLWMRQKLHLPREIRNGLGGAYTKKIVFCEHHESHAASAFFPSPFEEAAVITFDGVGEWSTMSYGRGLENRVELTHELRFPHSLGLLYSALTYFCGFRVNSGEYKLMGLAPYGEPRFAELMMNTLMDLADKGDYIGIVELLLGNHDPAAYEAATARFTDMVDELHNMGFKVMVVSFPFVLDDEKAGLARSEVSRPTSTVPGTLARDGRPAVTSRSGHGERTPRSTKSPRCVATGRPTSLLRRARIYPAMSLRS